MRRHGMAIVVAIIALGLEWPVAASAQDPKPVIRKPAPTTRIIKPAPSDPRVTNAEVTSEGAIGLSPEPTVTEQGPTESGPDVTCTITASRDPYENVPIPNGGVITFGPSEERRVYFHTRRWNLGGSPFPNAWARTRVLVNDVVIKEIPTLESLGKKGCQDCLPVHKSTHAVDLVFPLLTGFQVVGTMENDIHDVVTESNENNNQCTTKFTAKTPGTQEPFEVY